VCIGCPRALFWCMLLVLIFCLLACKAAQSPIFDFIMANYIYYLNILFINIVCIHHQSNSTKSLLVNEFLD
jgi:hypothetical protein